MAGGVGLMGGSFNPIHFGHLIVARAVAEHLGLDRLILIPSATPPHKRDADDLADAADRLEMVRRATAGDPQFEVSDAEIRREGPSYTILTIEEFQRTIGQGTELFWIIGGDTLPDLHSWYRVGELVERCRIVTAVRPGFESPDLAPLAGTLTAEQVSRLRDGVIPTPRIDISATDIRQRIRSGRSVRYLVPEAVREHIERRRLYQDGSSAESVGELGLCPRPRDF